MSVLSIEKSYIPIQQDVKIRSISGEKAAVPDLDNPAIDQQKAVRESSQKLEVAVEQLNKTMEAYNTELKFSIHKESGRVSVKVIDSRDNSVIREIPPERALDFAAHVKKMLGVIFDKFI